MFVPDMQAPVVEECITTSLEERIHLLTKAHESLKGSDVYPFSNACIPDLLCQALLALAT
jgi:hypothetical protein